MRRERRIAKVAMARKLAVSLYWMWRQQRSLQPALTQLGEGVPRFIRFGTALLTGRSRGVYTNSDLRKPYT